VPPTNSDVATALYEIADLLELRGDDRFRILGYRRAADAVEASSREVCGMSISELTAMRGVGKGIAGKVAEFCDTGRIGTLDELRGQIPPGMRELTLIPGLGPKRAMLVFTELGVSSVDELYRAAEQGRLTEVKGLGPKFVEQILAAVARGVRPEQRVLLARALPLAESMLAELGRCDAVVAAA